MHLAHNQVSFGNRIIRRGDAPDWSAPAQADAPAVRLSIQQPSAPFRLQALLDLGNRQSPSAASASPRRRALPKACTHAAWRVAGYLLRAHRLIQPGTQLPSSVAGACPAFSRIRYLAAGLRAYRLDGDFFPVGHTGSALLADFIDCCPLQSSGSSRKSGRHETRPIQLLQQRQHQIAFAVTVLGR
jgi:hypothetical protein